MKVVILAGGLGTRIIEESNNKPKPMIEIGGMPIIWHIMKYYSCFGFSEFIICSGYKHEYFVNKFNEHFSLEYRNIFNDNIHEYHSYENNWEIKLVNTGLYTSTAGRLKKIAHLLDNNSFHLSYGDTLSNVNLDKLLHFHQQQNVIATLTTVQPKCEYGVITFDKNDKMVKSFKEKPIEKDRWINGGFYIFDPGILEYIQNEQEMLENGPLESLVQEKKLAAYKHFGFWHSIETYKDKLIVNEIWEQDKAEWKIWDQKIKKSI